MKNGAQIVSDPDLGEVLSLEAPEAWVLIGDFKGILAQPFLNLFILFFDDVIVH